MPGEVEPRRPREAEGSLAPRPFQARATPRVNDDTGLWQPTWTIHGVVRRVALLQPAAVHFRLPLIRGQRFPTEVIKGTAATAVRGWSVRHDPGQLDVSVSRRKDDSREFEVAISPRQTLPAGPLKATVHLVPHGGDGSDLPAVEVVVEGKVLEDVHPVPGTIPFGAKPVGERAAETVVLRSEKGAAFEVEKVETGSPDLTVHPEPSGRPSEKQFRLSQRVKAAEFQTGVVQFHVRSEGQAVKIPVTWSYYGVAP